MPKWTFFTGIDRISTSIKPYKGIEIWDGYFFVQDRVFIKSLLSRFKMMLGIVEYDYLVDACPALFYKYVDIEGEIPAADMIRSTTFHLSRAQSFIHSLWLVKDNAVFCDRGWLLREDGLRGHNNNWNSWRTNCTGGTETVNFSASELKIMSHYVSREINYPGKSENPTALTDESHRFTRFSFFVDGARADGDLAMKVIDYCSSLEALLGNSTHELSHQIAERAAVLCAREPEKRIEIYRRTKKCYDIRSRAVHGATFKQKDFQNLREAVIFLDWICRLLTILFLEDEEFHSVITLKSEQFDEAFREILFGRRYITSNLQTSALP